MRTWFKILGRIGATMLGGASDRSMQSSLRTIRYLRLLWAWYEPSWKLTHPHVTITCSAAQSCTKLFCKIDLKKQRIPKKFYGVVLEVQTILFSVSLRNKPTLICPDNLRNGPTYEDLASLRIRVIRFTPTIQGQDVFQSEVRAVLLKSPKPICIELTFVNKHYWTPGFSVLVGPD